MIRLGFEDTGAITGLHQTHIEGRSRRQEHYWYPNVVRFKRGVLSVNLAGSVTVADRRGADRGNGFTMIS